MLCVNKHTQKYIDECCSKVEAQISAYKNLNTTVRNKNAIIQPKLHVAIESFEPVFFNNMVLVLDNYFVHRTRTIERIKTH
jgi:hypothetical protein